MATQVTTSLPMWLAGCTYDVNGGNDLRASGVAAYFYDQGIVSGGGTIGVLGGVIGGAGLDVTASTGMSVNVQPGHYVVPNTGTPTAGGYVSTLTATATLTVQTADPSNPRIDIVVAYVSDVGSSASFGAVEIITGVPAATPTAPAAPANSITLAQITVPAGVTAMTNGMIADVRPFTTTTGGVLIAPKGAVTGYRGQIAFDEPSGTFYHNDNLSNATQMHVLPWEPVVAKLSAPVTIPAGSAEVTVITTTITTDGYTDIEIFFKCPAMTTVANHAGSIIRGEFRMYVDNVLTDTFYAADVDASSILWQSGVSWSYYTSPATADTPAAGTHTVKVTVQNTASSFSYQVAANSASNILLRVEPVAM